MNNRRVEEEEEEDLSRNKKSAAILPSYKEPVLNGLGTFTLVPSSTKRLAGFDSSFFLFLANFYHQNKCTVVATEIGR